LYPNREAKQVNTSSNSSVLSLGGDFYRTAFIFPHSSLSGKSNEAFTESGVSPRTRSRLDVGRPDRGSLAGRVAPMITIELFGVPLLRVGRGSVTLETPTLKRALDELGRICPGLDGSVIDQGHTHPMYRVCLNGDRLVSDPETPIADGDVLLFLDANVGG
jgi:molybdopterin converting factor small subunit